MMTAVEKKGQNHKTNGFVFSPQKKTTSEKRQNVWCKNREKKTDKNNKIKSNQNKTKTNESIE